MSYRLRLKRRLTLILVLGSVAWFVLPSSLRTRISPVAQAATFTVTNTNDDGPGSLRSAIVTSNQSANPGVNTITFNIPGSGIQTIVLNSGLPTVTASVTIDGTTQPGFSGTPLIGLDGQATILGLPNRAASPNATTGMEISGGNSTVRGLRFKRFSGSSLWLNTNGNNVVQGNYFGVDGPISVAMRISSSNNLIGGTTAAARNVVSGNPYSGIDIEGESNIVQGNYIGTDPAGLAAKANAVGVEIHGNNNLVGGAAAGAGNLISGNGFGVFIQANGNVIQGNRIGTDATGSAALGNGDGIQVAGGENNLIKYNLISGNTATGVRLLSSSQSSTLIGNLIGVTSNALFSLANQTGVAIDCANNTIGPAVNASSDVNTIAGNSGDGLAISGSNNLVRSNLIGTSAQRTIQNGGDGIRLSGSLNTIGGSLYSTTNVISGNGGNGIRIVGAAAVGNLIMGNRIGIDASPSLLTQPNLANGVLIESAASNNTIGSATNSTLQQQNFIGFNKGDGIRVTRGFDNKVLGNYVHDNVGAGVFVDDSGLGVDNNVSITGNRIYSNGGLAIDLLPAGVNPNDAGDNDTGPNGRQNFPSLSSAVAAIGRAFIKGSLNSKANSRYRLEFFDSITCDASGNGESNGFLGFTSITTDTNGIANFEFSSSQLNDASQPGHVVTATATDAQGNTSEMSPCLNVLDGGYVSLTQNRTTKLESDGAVTITVIRQGGQPGPVSVDYATTNMSATAGSDYTAVSGTLNFATNENQKSITIPILNDSLPEGIELFHIQISNPQGGPGLLNRDEDIIIDDDELPAGIIYAITVDNHLLSFNSTRPDAILDDAPIVGEKIVHIDFRPATGQLYGIGESGHLYTINLATKALTQVGISVLPNFGGFEFNPVTDRIRIANENGNVEVSPTTGAVLNTGSPLAFASGDTNFGHTPRILALAHTNNVAGATSTTLFGIHWTGFFDPTQLVRVGSPGGAPISPDTGQTFTIASTLAATQTYAGFDISDTGEAFAVLTHPEAGVFGSLFKVNLATGSTDRIGTLIDHNQSGIADIAVQPAEKIEFKNSIFSVNENIGTATITVTRNSVGGITAFDWTTEDGTAIHDVDYQAASGDIIFHPGEKSKTFTVNILDDAIKEGVESINLSFFIWAADSGGLSGTTRTAKIAIMDEPTEAGTTPIDNADFFVRQHYADFLNRQPDSGGLTFWTNHITQCFNDAACVHEQRIGTSAAFFIENEFQQTGFFIYRIYQASLGRRPTYAEFTNDRGQVIGGANLEAGRQAFATGFVQRQGFLDKYPISMDGPAFVDALINTAGAASGIVDLNTRRTNLIALYNTGANQTDSRVKVVRGLSDDSAFSAALYNPAFVLMQYFGYLRRPPDQAGYDFWLDHLNNRTPNNYRAMVCSFITSHEYQRRFSTIITRSNQDCEP